MTMCGRGTVALFVMTDAHHVYTVVKWDSSFLQYWRCLLPYQTAATVCIEKPSWVLIDVDHIYYVSLVERHSVNSTVHYIQSMYRPTRWQSYIIISHPVCLSSSNTITKWSVDIHEVGWLIMNTILYVYCLWVQFESSQWLHNRQERYLYKTESKNNQCFF
jgi:hypothetical protein